MSSLTSSDAQWHTHSTHTHVYTLHTYLAHTHHKHIDSIWGEGYGYWVRLKGPE